MGGRLRGAADGLERRETPMICHVAAPEGQALFDGGHIAFGQCGIKALERIGAIPDPAGCGGGSVGVKAQQNVG